MNSFMILNCVGRSTASASSESTSSASVATNSSAPREISARKPADILPGTEQPHGPILKWVWLIKRKAGNNLYECKLCEKRFTGQPSSVGTHFDKKFSSQRLLFCISALPLELREELDATISKKKKSEKRDFASMSQSDIVVSMKSMTKPLADSAILQFIVTLGLSASIVEDQSFRNLAIALRDAGPNYVPPKRHLLGLNKTTFVPAEMETSNPLGLGKVLHEELQRVRGLKQHLYQGLEQIGGTLCNDGAKWRKRSLINSTLMSAQGAYFAQSTDATGKFKDAKYILDDILSAVANVGQKNVFIVCLDGACKKTLKMIWDEPSLNKIFPQRCTTHGCNLLIADIGKLFKWEINMCVRLVKFVCNHDTIFSLFKE